MKKMKLVMVGNGMAGVRTLEELLKIAPDLYDITVFGAEPIRLAGKLRQRFQHRPGNRVGHQGLQQILFQRTLERREHREGREQGQHHGDQGHQCDQGGEGQAAGRLAEPVFAKALPQRDGGVEPGPGLQGFEHARGLLAPRGLDRHREIHRWL